jgi:hypothetical protein
MEPAGERTTPTPESLTLRVGYTTEVIYPIYFKPRGGGGGLMEEHNPKTGGEVVGPCQNSPDDLI